MGLDWRKWQFEAFSRPCCIPTIPIQSLEQPQLKRSACLEGPEEIQNLSWFEWEALLEVLHHPCTNWSRKYCDWCARHRWIWALPKKKNNFLQKIQKFSWNRWKCLKIENEDHKNVNLLVGQWQFSNLPWPRLHGFSPQRHSSCSHRSRDVFDGEVA